MTSIEQVLQHELQKLDDAGNLRRLRVIERADGPVVDVTGRKLLSFGSNDYLGLAGRNLLPDGKTLQSGSTGSRLTTGSFLVHEQLEAEIASFKHTDSAIVFSSGYAANIGTIQALATRGDLIISDELNHASLIDGCRLSRADVRIYNHADYRHARSLLSDRSSYRRVLLVTDGVFSMDGDIAPLPELVALSESADCWLMVDDAHGTGVFGPTGAGVVEHFGLSKRVQIQMGTLSKAVGCAGGFVAGSAPLINWLRNNARSFMFSTAPPPSDMQAAIQAVKAIRAQPELRDRLHQNILQLRTGLSDSGIPIKSGLSPIIPLITGTSESAVELSANLEEAGIWIPAIRPPTVPPGSARLRLTVTAAHTAEQIDQALTEIKGLWVSR